MVTNQLMSIILPIIEIGNLIKVELVQHQLGPLLGIKAKLNKLIFKYSPMLK